MWGFRCFLFLGLVTLFWVDCLVAEDFTSGGDDGGVESVDERDDVCFVVLAANAEVEHFVAPTEADASLVDCVVADAPKVWVVGRGGVCFRDQVVGLMVSVSL